MIKASNQKEFDISFLLLAMAIFVYKIKLCSTWDLPKQWLNKKKTILHQFLLHFWSGPFDSFSPLLVKFLRTPFAGVLCLQTRQVCFATVDGASKRRCDFTRKNCGRYTMVPNTEIPSQNKFIRCGFRSFFKQISANLQLFPFPGDEFYTQTLSNCCRCKYDQSISRFFNILFLAGFCN